MVSGTDHRSSGFFVGINEFGERPDCPGLFGHKYRACPHPLNNKWKCIRYNYHYVTKITIIEL
ncbi:hypothetical protein ANCCAN_00128 [Ancylostoma caninum]|uniref:Uncharacterized protein n=1 Tax=Ancylostoma caninum TaxID=29170 RepID=A0A368HAL5_ANCCA|nr:hypothetical protein ANCCAN_00128 [Ancylostoma caninum]